MTTFVLVPGMWLGAWAWRDVTGLLRKAGHEVYPVTLTGLAERRHLGGPGVDLDTHATDVAALIETEELTDVVLVGHSYGGFVVTAVADRIPERLREVVYLDSGPLPNGTSLLTSGDEESQRKTKEQVGDGWEVPPRDWDAEADPYLLAGLSPEMLAELRRRSTPHPYGSVAQPLVVSERAASVPRTMIACTFPLDQVKSMIADGHPWFTGLVDARLLGLPTGHWPMFSAPDGLVDLLSRAGER
jgi:pimeloyl-ACP methyl ester carboxylesterase